MEEKLEVKYLNSREASAYLNVGKRLLIRWENEGKLKPIRINARGDKRYTREMLEGVFSEMINN